MPQRRNKARSGVVRREQFERSLDAMNYEMSLKTAESMAKYHTEYVEPIEKRLRTIELLFGVALARWCYWKLDDAWHWLYMKFTKSVSDSEVGEEPGGSLSSARKSSGKEEGVAPDPDALPQPVYPH